MMSEIANRVLGAASIEEIETAIAEHEKKIAELRNEIEALNVIRKALILRRDGRPERKARSPRKSEPPHQDQKRETSQPFEIIAGEVTADTVARFLQQFPDSTCGQISHGTKIPYQSVYGALKAVRFNKVGDRYRCVSS